MLGTSRPVESVEGVRDGPRQQEQLDSPKFDVLKAVYNKVFTEGISPRCTHSKVGGEVILQ